MKPVLLIGAGRMGGGLLNGWIRADIHPLIVVDPNPSAQVRKVARARQVQILKTIEYFCGRARACVIAIKPQVFKNDATSFAGVAQSGALMISIAAGTSTNFMRDAWGREARIIRAMPNTPGSIGRGISALYAAPTATVADRKFAQRLLAALGETIWLQKESLIDSVTAVSGSGPAYVFLLAEALAEAAQAEGLSRNVAERLARATVSGAGALLDGDKRPVVALRRDVTSPGGTTEAALQVLTSEGALKALIARAVRAARRRAEELASWGTSR